MHVALGSISAMSNNSNHLLLNYHDAVLYPSDLSILESPTAWLNDACIQFVLTRLSHQTNDSNQQQQRVRAANVQFHFVDPSVLSFLMHQWDPEDDGGNPVDMLGLKDWNTSRTQQSIVSDSQQRKRRTKLVFFPINDNYTSQSWHKPGGGTHWTLLLLWLPLGVATDDSAISSSSAFYHFDSSPSSDNRKAALALARKLGCTTTTPQIYECRVPRQTNGYDCGLHMLGTVKALADCLLRNDTGSSVDNNEPPTPELLEGIVRHHVATSPNFCCQLRQDIVRDIRALIDS